MQRNTNFLLREKENFVAFHNWNPLHKRQILTGLIYFIASIYLYFNFFAISCLPVSGEGSATFLDVTATGRSFLRPDSVYSTIFRVYVKPGEKILLGSSSFMRSNDIEVIYPDGTKTIFDITATGYSQNNNNTCEYSNGGIPAVFTTAPTSRSKGLILNYIEEMAGPKPFNSAGFDPIEINVEHEGYVDVLFHSSNSTGEYKFVRYDSVFQNNPVLDNNVSGCRENKMVDAVAAWDITVVGVDGLKKDGRVFTDRLFFRNNDSTRSSFVGYVLSDDGYIYKVDTGKINGIDWYFFANNRGIVHSASDKTFYGSLYGCLLNSNKNSDKSSPEYDSGCGFQTYFPKNMNFAKNSKGDVAYRIFLNYPDVDLLSYINLSSPKPEIPEVSNLAFTKSKN